MANLEGFTPHLELKEKDWKNDYFTTILLVKFTDNISEHTRSIKNWGGAP